MAIVHYDTREGTAIGDPRFVGGDVWIIGGPGASFDYDCTEFKIETIMPMRDDPDIRMDILEYIGSETDGSKIKIPDGVDNCFCMFSGTNIKTPPVIPDGVKGCCDMFANCKNLTTAAVLPDSVVDCEEMYMNCENLKTVSVIPEGVENCDRMFDGCVSLTEPPVVPKSVTHCNNMVYGCSAGVIEGTGWNIRHRGQSYIDYKKNLGSKSRGDTVESDLGVTFSGDNSTQKGLGE